MSEQHTEAGEETETATGAEETEEGADAETTGEDDGQTHIV